jgi:pyridoxine/pyridoxamine 5'-phosphate oxidase
MTLSDVCDYLAAQRYGVVSSLHASGAPEAALVGIGWWRRAQGAGELVFDTAMESRKARNLLARPRCAVVVGWDDETTVQIEGEARSPQDAELEAAKAAYFETWPDGRERQSWPGLGYFVIRPTWLRYSRYLPDHAIVEFGEADLWKS